MILRKVIRNTWASITYYFFLTSCHRDFTFTYRHNVNAVG